MAVIVNGKPVAYVQGSLTGTAGVSGTTTSVSGNLVMYTGTSGTNIANAGILAASVLTSGSVPAFDATASDIKMNGVQSAGSTGLIPNSDHVHPSDTSRATTANKIDDFAVPGTTDTTKDANTTNHGLLLKAVAPASGLMNFIGLTFGETIYSLKALFSATTPSMDGSAAAGTALTAARIDHVHPSDTSLAPKASPTFTGTPSLPTGTTGVTQTARSNNTTLATTAYVDNQTRIKLSSATTFYVSTTGTNDGAHGTSSGTPWLTIQYAYNYLCANYDFGGQQVTIQCAAGTYTAGLSTFYAWSGGGTLVLQGASGTPSQATIDTYIINVASGNALTLGCPEPGNFTITGFKIVASAFGLQISVPGIVCTLNYVDWGVCNYHIYVSAAGSYLYDYQTSYISGSATNHWALLAASAIYAGGLSCTISSAVSMTAFLNCGYGGTINFSSATFTNSSNVTGSKYTIINGGTALSGGITLPGTTAGSGGTTTGGGFYL